MQRFGKVIWKHLRGFFGPLGGLLGDSWRPLEGPWRLSGGLLEASWGLLGPSWGPLGGLLGVLEVDLKLNIVLEGLHFSGGPSWSCLGVVLSIF